MDLLLMIAIFIAGIILIIQGGGWFVDAASWMAEVSGIPKLIVGATIVSVATTMPEMIVSVMAASQGKVDMSVGNAVGSVTANLGLIMAIAILCMPGIIRRRDYFVKSLLMLTAAGMIAAAGRQGEVGPQLSALLLAVFAVFIAENVRFAMTAGEKSGGGRRMSPEKRAVLWNAVKFIAGAAGVVVGADLLVDSGSALARLVGVSERIIGVTIVAVGTSLPELATTITAVVKKQSALSVGNILGANIIDLTLILPLSGLVAGKAMPISAAAGRIDLPACLLVGCAAVIPPMFTKKFQRWQGAVLLAAYAGYILLTCGVQS